MAAKPVREYFGKQLLAKYLGEASGGEFEFEGRGMLVKSGASDPASPSSWAALLAAHPWARDARLVAKPDQLIKRRGKAGLLAIDKTFDECRAWVDARMNATIDVEGVEGVLHTFLVEPFVPHAQADEYYVCVVSNREGEELLFCKDGGVDVGDVDAKAKRLQVPLGESAAPDALAAALLDGVPEARKPKLARFLATLLGVYRQLHFVYMEINPIVFEEGGKITPLDLAAKLDETAAFLAVPNSTLQLDFNVSVRDGFDAILLAWLRELDESDRFVQNQPNRLRFDRAREFSSSVRTAQTSG